MYASERKFHRKAASACFNKTWEFMEKKRRTKEDDMTMLNMAHASRYHWSLIGTPHNFAVGDWQVSRVYFLLGDSRLSVAYAKSCLGICEKNQLSDMMHVAHEGMALALVGEGKKKKAARQISLAKSALSKLELDSEELNVYKAQIAKTDALIRGMKSKSLTKA